MSKKNQQLHEKAPNWSFKKWIIMINVSILILDIHRSKGAVQELQDSRDEEIVHFFGLFNHPRQDFIDQNSPK